MVFFESKDEFSNNFICSVSPNLVHKILKDIPSLNYPSNLTILSRIGCDQWNVEDSTEINDENRPQYEYLRGGNCLWSDRKLIKFPIDETLKIKDYIMKSRGICIQHDSKTIAKSFAIHIVTFLTEFKVFYISGEDFTKQSAKRLNKELPRKALLFVDQPHIFEGNVRRE